MTSECVNIYFAEMSKENILTSSQTFKKLSICGSLETVVCNLLISLAPSFTEHLAVLYKCKMANERMKKGSKQKETRIRNGRIITKLTNPFVTFIVVCF